MQKKSDTNFRLNDFGLTRYLTIIIFHPHPPSFLAAGVGTDPGGDADRLRGSPPGGQAGRRSTVGSQKYLIVGLVKCKISL